MGGRVVLGTFSPAASSACTSSDGKSRQHQAAAGSIRQRSQQCLRQLAWCGVRRVRVSGNIIYSFSEGRERLTPPVPVGARASRARVRLRGHMGVAVRFPA